MSKRQGIFTENFTIFFSNAGETVNVPTLEIKRFWKIIFGTSTKFHIWHRHLTIQV